MPDKVCKQLQGPHADSPDDLPTFQGVLVHTAVSRSCMIVHLCRRTVRPTPGRIAEADLLELADSLEKEAPSLANCFNSGLCNWLCQHRQAPWS